MRARHRVAAVLGVAVVVSTAPVAAVPAAAAAGDVFTIDTWTSYSGGSTWVFRDASASLESGTLVLSGTNEHAQEVGVSARPPSGGWAAGTTYPVASFATSTHARVVTWGLTAHCVTPTAGTIRVDEASYDATGALQSFAGRYSLTCDRSTWRAGEVRWRSARPWSAVRLAGWHALPSAAMGSTVTRTLTLSAEGTGAVTPGAPALTGAHSGDYAIADDSCAGTSLTDGASCTMTLRFSPGESYATDRQATLTVPLDGGASSVSRFLTAKAVHSPPPPTGLTGMASADGAGLAWSSASGDRVVVQRKVDGAWAELARLDSQVTSYVDPTLPPGETAEYAVASSSDGVDGERSAPVAVTRLAQPSSPGDTSLVVVTGASAPRRFSTGDGFVASSQPGRFSLHSDSAPGATAEVPVVPGPGTYELGGGVHRLVLTPWPCADLSSTSGEVTGVMTVRDALYAADRTPLLLDASVAVTCPDLGTQRVELQLRDATSYSLPTTTPRALGVVTTRVGATSAPVTLSVRGQGVPVALGAARITGAAAADWAVTASTCAGATLADGETCSVSIAFTPTAERARNARLEVPATVGGQASAPVLAVLRGFGATTPQAPPTPSVLSGVERVGIHWLPPADDGGYPVTSYDVRRSTEGGEPVVLGSTTTTRFVDPSAVAGSGYRYQVRAVNDVGAGEWSALPSAAVGLSDRGYVGVARSSENAVWDLTGFDHHDRVAITADGHEHATPGTDWAGTVLVYARAETPGAEQYDYDLWVRPLRGAEAPRRLTSSRGAEVLPAVSPDGRTVAYTAFGGGLPSVWLVPVDGSGPARMLVREASYPSWTTDGKAVVVEDDSSDEAPLVRVDVETGARSPLSGTAGGFSPAVARDGQVAFISADGELLVRSAAGVVAPPPGLAVWPFEWVDRPWWSASGDLVFALEDGWAIYRPASASTTRMPSQGWEAAEVVPVQVDAGAPTVAVTVASPSGRRPAVTIQRADDTTPADSLVTTCALDDAPSPCAPTGVGDGRHVLTVTVTDAVGRTASASAAFVVDGTAPRVPSLTGPAAVSLGATASWSYASADAGTGVASYDVRYRTASPTSSFGAHATPAGFGRRTSRTVALTMAPGREYCVSVRARDRVGNVSGWSAERCTAAPLDDRSLSRSTGWKSVSSKAAYRSTVTQGARKAAVLRTGSVSTRRVSLVVTTCSTCGPVQVYIGSRLLGTVSTRSSTTQWKRVVNLPVPASAISGALVLKTTSTAKVLVDGVVLRRT